MSWIDLFHADLSAFLRGVLPVIRQINPGTWGRVGEPFFLASHHFPWSNGHKFGDIMPMEHDDKPD